MGLLTTLDAPSFREEFLPQVLLKAPSTATSVTTCLRSARRKSSRAAAHQLLDAVRERDDSTRDIRVCSALRLPVAAPGGRGCSSSSLQLEGEQLGRYAGTLRRAHVRVHDARVRFCCVPRPCASTSSA